MLESLNIKSQKRNIKVFFALFFLATVNIAVLSTSETASALTREQKIECLEKWGNRGTGSAVPDGTPSYNEANYLKSNCDKSDGGNCKIDRYEDGSAINCIDPRTGLDDRGVDPNPDTPGANLDGCSGIETSLIDCDDTGGNPVINMMLQIFNFFAVGVGIAVVGGIIWGGLIYASSNGDASKVQQAKTIIVNAVIGLLIFIFMYAFINFLVPGGVFT